MYYRSGTEKIIFTHLMAAQNFSTWHDIMTAADLSHQIENLTVNRCFFTWRTILRNFIQISQDETLGFFWSGRPNNLAMRSVP